MAATLLLALVARTSAVLNAYEKHKDFRLPLSPQERTWKSEVYPENGDAREWFRQANIVTSSNKRSLDRVGTEDDDIAFKHHLAEVKVDRIGKNYWNLERFPNSKFDIKLPDNIRKHRIHGNANDGKGTSDTMSRIRSRTKAGFVPSKFSYSKQQNSKLSKGIETQRIKVGKNVRLSENFDLSDDLEGSEQTFFESMMQPLRNMFSSDNPVRQRRPQRCRSGLRCQRVRPNNLEEDNTELRTQHESISSSHVPGLRSEGTLIRANVNPENEFKLLDNDGSNVGSHFKLIIDNTIQAQQQQQQQQQSHQVHRFQNQKQNNRPNVKHENQPRDIFSSNLPQAPKTDNKRKKRNKSHLKDLVNSEDTSNYSPSRGTASKNVDNSHMGRDHPIILTEPFEDMPPMFIRVPIEYSPNKPPPILILKEMHPDDLQGKTFSQIDNENIKNENFNDFGTSQQSANILGSNGIQNKRNQRETQPNTFNDGVLKQSPQQISFPDQKQTGKNHRDESNSSTDNRNIGDTNEQHHSFTPSTVDPINEFLANAENTENTGSIHNKLNWGDESITHKEFASGREITQNNQRPPSFIHQLSAPSHLSGKQTVPNDPNNRPSVPGQAFSSPVAQAQFSPNSSPSQGFVPIRSFSQPTKSNIDISQEINNVVRLNPINLLPINNNNNDQRQIQSISLPPNIQRSPINPLNNNQQPNIFLNDQSRPLHFHVDTRSPAERISSYTSLDAPVPRSESIPNSHFEHVNAHRDLNSLINFNQFSRSEIPSFTKEKNLFDFLDMTSGRIDPLDKFEDHEPAHITLKSPKFSLSVQFAPTKSVSFIYNKIIMLN